MKTAQEAIAAGRQPQSVRGSYLHPDSLVEVKPTGKTTGEIVWEWHVWDHLIQDFDKTKANYGKVAEHPELININYDENALAPIMATQSGVDKLKSIGYLGSSTTAGKRRSNQDCTHFNSVAYDSRLDQIMVCVRSFSEFWIIDHSTTMAEAAGHKGGRYGKGGDLLYRWGNPLAYGAGTDADRRLYSPHDAHWIPLGLSGAGRVLVFNNGINRPGGSYSSAEEIVLPVDAEGRYPHRQGTCFGPHEPHWSYASPEKSDLYSALLSGAQRLPNGNTLICSGMMGSLIEVTPEKEIVWSYTTQFQNVPGNDWSGIPGPFGATGPGPMRRPGGHLPGGVLIAPGSIPLFRAHRYAPSYPGLAGKDLTARKTIAELEAKIPKQE
jgi:hypothetical protein